MKNSQRGFTLIESMVVAMIVSIIVSSAGMYIVGWLHAERQRTAAYQLYAELMTARMEAVNRNRPCRLLVDTLTGALRVIDLNGTSSTADDEEILATELDAAITFERPDGVAAVTLTALSGTEFEARFDQDGSLASGVGAIGIRSGDRYHRISVYAAGGIVIERWTGATWQLGG